MPASVAGTAVKGRLSKIWGLDPTLPKKEIRIYYLLAITQAAHIV